ncbi:FATC domain-containing protein [Babesia ovis]|uniref:non-specific serine/threonine protein kinase n=1 Tax=Babesia ovis TaxID=5869 RepID=A0A9W5TEB0_BABOV|nr:FATC domain-containing protein [Babesia ovis]
MAESLLDDIRLLRQILERSGIRQFSERLVQLTSGTDQSHEFLLRKCWELCQHDSIQLLGGNPNYVLYGKLRKLESKWNGTRSYKRLKRASPGGINQLLSPQGPFSVVFSTILMPLLKGIKLLCTAECSKAFHRAIYCYSTVVSSMFTGAYGPEFYEDIDSDDLRRMVSFFRHLLSVILDTQIDRVYVNGDIPVRTTFAWSRSIVHVANIIHGSRPQLIEGFQEDLVADFLDVLRERYGTTVSLFRRSLKTLQLVGAIMDTTKPAVVVNDNSVRVLSILISEFCYNTRVDRSVTLDNNCDLLSSSAWFTSAIYPPSGYLLNQFCLRIASYLLERSLRPLAAVVGNLGILSHHLALWQAYSYLAIGYCNLHYKGNFVKHALGNDDGYHSNALLDLLDYGRNSPNYRITTSQMTVLRSLRLMQEVVTYLIHDAANTPKRSLISKHGNQVSNETRIKYLTLTSRILLVWHLYYYRRFIQQVGVHAHDCDYYTTFFRMATVALNRYRLHIPTETADILISIVVISLDVIKRSHDRPRLIQVVLHALLRPPLSTSKHFSMSQTAVQTNHRPESQDSSYITTPTTDSITRDVLLRVDPYSYSCVNRIVQGYIKATNRPYDIMKTIYANLQSRGYKIDSIIHLGHSAMARLLGHFGKYDRLRKSTIWNGGTSPQSSCSPETPSRPKVGSYAFTKCFPINLTDESSVVMVCLASEAAIRLLLRHDSMEKADVALSFIFFNSLALLLLMAQDRISSNNDPWRRYSTTSLILETYTHVQVIEICPSMRSSIRAPLLSVMHLCDSIVEVLLYRLLDPSSHKVDSAQSTLSTSTPKGKVLDTSSTDNVTCSTTKLASLSNKETLLILASLRSVVSSPIKEAIHVINTLCLLVRHNSGQGPLRPSISETHNQSRSQGSTAVSESQATWLIDHTATRNDATSGKVITPGKNSCHNQRSVVIEKLLVHAMTRYLASVAVNFKRLMMNPKTATTPRASLFSDMFKAVTVFIKSCTQCDISYNAIQVLPHMLNLWNILRSDPGMESYNMVAHCMASESLNRRLHAVAHTIPLLTDPNSLFALRRTQISKIRSAHSIVDSGGHECAPVIMGHNGSNTSVFSRNTYTNGTTDSSENASIKHVSGTRRGSTTSIHSSPMANHRKERIPYTRYISLYTAKLPHFCFHCRVPLVATRLRHSYYVICDRCHLASPLVCDGQVDLHNRSLDLFVSTQVPMTSRHIVGTTLPLGSQHTCDIDGVTLDHDLIATLLESQLGFLRNDVSHDLRSYISMDLSNIWAQWLCSTIDQRALDIAGRLEALGPTCILWLQNKSKVYRCLSPFTKMANNIGFFNSRFMDNMAIMADTSTDVDHMRRHYLCDLVSISLGCSRSLDSESDCIHFWNTSLVLTANLSTTTLSQIFTQMLQEIIDSEFRPPEPLICAVNRPTESGAVARDMLYFPSQKFGRAWLALSQLCNILSIPVSRLAISGLCLTPVRLMMTTRSKLTPVQNLTKSMLDLVMHPLVIDRLEELHEGTMKNVLCTDDMLQHSLDNCDYRLFQLLQSIHNGTDPSTLIEQLQRLDKYRFYALVRLLWHATNPHVMVRLDSLRDRESLLEAQTNYVASPFGAYLEHIRTKKTHLPHGVLSKANPLVPSDNHSQYQDPPSLNDRLVYIPDKANKVSAIVEYLRENFVRILEYFVAVWLNRAQQTLNFALKNKRVFYPEIYGYSDNQCISHVHIARTYNCIAILICIYQGDIDVFCDRLIEVLTLRPIDVHIGSVLLNCWAVLSRKISSEVLALCAPGIAYYLACIEKIGIDPDDSRELINEIKSRLQTVDYGQRPCAYIDCVVACVRSPMDLDGIETKLEMLASMLHSEDRVKVPYITREAAAVTANHLLELHPFVSNMDRAKASASRLAEAALFTIAEYSDDFSKTPTTLATACCSILGYVPCDSTKSRVPTRHFIPNGQQKQDYKPQHDQQKRDHQARHGHETRDSKSHVLPKRDSKPLVQSDPRELADIVLRDYLIPNMHLQVALYCIQEILKLLHLYKGGVRSQQELDEMTHRWNNSFDPVTRRAIEPYRATSFLRNRAIEGVIETCLDGNTVLDIKSFVWWLLKMLPSSCPSLCLFRACDLAMVKIPSVLTFLLPYIVESCVQFLDDDQCATIGKRVASLLCNILKRDSATFGINWQPPYEVVSKSRHRLDSTDQYTSCQAIFNLLDGIKVLTDRYRKELAALQKDPGSTSPKRRKLAGTGTLRQEEEHIKSKMRRLDSILFAVPELLVAHAAISCGSYARGVMIIEKKMAIKPRSYNFNDPARALSDKSLRKNIVDNGGLDPQAIISLLCRGYLGLGDLDSLVCISTIVLNDDSQRSKSNTRTDTNGSTAITARNVSNTGTDTNGNTAIRTRNASIDKRQREACRAFSYECRGKYRQACDVYNRLLKNSQDARLWTSWYRIIQMTGPTVFIKLPPPPDLDAAAESLMAESLTACWKLALWDELDAFIAKKHSREAALLDIHFNDTCPANILLVERSDNTDAGCSQLTQCTVDGSESDVFWESLMMRDPIDVWFMEQTAYTISHLQKHNYAASDETIQKGFKHLIRPLGLAIRESTLVAKKYLEKIATLNALRLCSRFNNGQYDHNERGFAQELTTLVRSSTNQNMRTLLDILGTAKVALELGGKLDAASELMLTLNRICRVYKFDVHIPGRMCLDDEAFSGRNDVVLEYALTLQHKGHIDEAIASLTELARHDFEGFYNLVKMYTESNMLIPKRAIYYMREILKAAPQSFKANLLYAEYLDRLLDHRLRNARNFKVVLNDSAICSRRSPLANSVETTYKITGVDGVPGIYTFVELVTATVVAYLQSLCFISPSVQNNNAFSSAGQTTDKLNKPEHGNNVTTTDKLNVSQDGSDVTTTDKLNVSEQGNLDASKGYQQPGFTDDKQDGHTMDIVDILTKVIAIICFYCTPNTSQCLGSVTFENEACQIFANAIMDTFFEHNNSVPQFYWYSVISQLMSRCNHKLLGATLFQTLVARLVARYPKQALWSTLYFAHSVNSHMRQIHINIERKAREISPLSSIIVEYHHSIFKELIEVAMDTTVSTTEKSALRFQGLWRVINSQGCRDNAIIPTIRNLSFEHIINYDQCVEQSRICGLDEQMQVLRSKQKPKRLGFVSATGDVLNFLVKNEVKGDLRKDKRMMEVTQYVAKLLRRHYAGLPLQCYSVVSLTEVAGIIEWVPNMSTMRAVVSDELRHVTENGDRDSRADIAHYASAVTDKNYVESLKLFRRLCERRPPVLHRAYYSVFKRDPTSWFCARKEFIHTCAVWSILGYIVGLGDRHAENILLNLLTGQVMHVDFDCLFGKGLQLAVPELVPFRLTQNIISNLGVCGTATDGPFYSEALKFLQMLHRDRQKITAILMSFVFDPLIEWHRGESAPNGDGHSQKVLQCIENKLRGALNVVMPSVEINSSHSAFSVDEMSDPQALQNFENVAEIMEPREQLQKLIQVATSHAHLSKMFVGWAPWL